MNETTKAFEMTREAGVVPEPGPADAKYTMTISRLTVDKLGVKLYDRVSAVLAELVANSYDADATTVEIKAPMGEYLATKIDGVIRDKGLPIIVRDDGHGMTPEEVNAFYLRVGAERRKDPRRGDRSRRFQRRVMGNKGVGKLAPFGICGRIEVISAGGEVGDGVDSEGRPASGYRTAHLILDRTGILSDVDTNYEPVVGALDETVSARRGTTLVLSDFVYRFVPASADLTRQLAQRFGIQSTDWTIELEDTLCPVGRADRVRRVGAFDVPTMAGTRIAFRNGQAFGEDGNPVESIKAGFEHEDVWYEVNGWIGYAREPYKDDLMAGVRIYCRDKIAAQTAIFNRGAGFTGEHSVRSYLVGELRADWLDADEDLIQTDRRDILWSSEIGGAFEKWGQDVVVRLGRMATKPLKETAWARFRTLTNLETIVEERFPHPDQQEIRDRTTRFARVMAESMRGDQVEDEEARERVLDLSLVCGPHLTLDEKLVEASTATSPLDALADILKVARIAELSSFGKIAKNRVEIIQQLETKIDEQQVEQVYQDLLASAPWLIDPQWAPITANRSFTELRAALERHLTEYLGRPISLTPFGIANRRPDFVLTNHDATLEFVEIKRPKYVFQHDDMERLETYVSLVEEFLRDPLNKELAAKFPYLHFTLVCDDIRLLGMDRRAFDAFCEKQTLTPVNWQSFLARTKSMHRDFLAEAELQRQMVLPAPM